MIRVPFNLSFSLRKVAFSPIQQLVRTFSAESEDESASGRGPGEKRYLPFERKQFVRRYGFEPKHFDKGLLPRIRGDTSVLSTLRGFDKPNDWTQKKALVGQNDYIDILGDGTIDPTRLLTNIPKWLRGFRGSEIHMLQRKRAHFKHWQWSRPERYRDITKRINFLYKYLNYNHKPPKIQPY